MSTISSTVTHSVQLGTAGYTSPLTITTSGLIAPVSYGATGLTADVGPLGAFIRNDGVILGEAESGDVNGGVGVQIMSDVRVINGGLIAGGSTDFKAGTGNGGAGVDLKAASVLSNTGTIKGGSAYYYFGRQGGGGEYGGDGGTGVSLSGLASLTNVGEIVGGKGLDGGIGVNLAQASSFTNHGTILGGSGADGGVGLNVGTGCTATNAGLIVGGTGGYAGAYGADVASGATLINLGGIYGGETALPGGYFESVASVGVYGGTLINSGRLDNGLVLSSGYVSNTGRLSSAFVESGTLVNTGNITGPSIGVSLSGGTLVNAGRITGGPAGSSYSLGAVFVDPTDTSATLVVEAGATFGGLVQAGRGGIAILELGGTKPGLLGHLGTEFVGFDVIEVASGSDWTLQQSNSVGPSPLFFIDGLLAVSGLLQDAGTVTIRNDGELTVAQGGAARALSVNLAGGTLAGAVGGRLAVGNNVSASLTGDVTVDASGIVAGYGTITAPAGIVDNGIIVAGEANSGTGGGELDLRGQVSGSGVIDISPDTVLNIAGNLDVAKLTFATQDQLYLAATQPVTTTHIAGFGEGDTITLVGDLDATRFSYSDGTPSVYNGNSLADQFDFTGAYTSANFALSASNGEYYNTISFVANDTNVTRFAQALFHDAGFDPDRMQHF